MNKITRYHSIGAVVRNSLRMYDNHFKVTLPQNEAEQLFQESVELIEVETTSYCNRTCSFCPNSFIDRRSKKQSMPESVWQKILDDLQSINYSGSFVWARYSEPLSEPRIIERIREVRQAAPECRISINTNGDFLNPDYLNKLEEASLNRLFIDIYIPDEETYNLEVAKKYLKKFSERINRSYQVLNTSPEVLCKVDSLKLSIVAVVRNIASFKKIDMSDRGGLMQNARKASRTAPCYAPYKHLVIDWDGSVVVCCQVRSDSSNHANTVVGKIGVDGLSLIEAYIRLAEWRQSLRTYGAKKSPCATCNVSEYESTLLTRSLSRFLVNTKSPVIKASKSILHPLLKNKNRF